ncbi:MAG: hypothetical protein ABJB01_07570 [Rudaea sp.]
MNMTSILTRAVLLSVFGVGVSFAMVNRIGHVNAATPAPQRETATAANVEGKIAIVELPTIDVRPSAEDLAEAAREPVAREIVSARSVPVVDRPQTMHIVAPTLPSLGLDMPYYSFGKALPRVSKE